MSATELSDYYFEQLRPEVLALVPTDVKAVLELGCAAGIMSSALKERQLCDVTGIEYSPEAAAQARTRLDRVIEGDCESLDFESLLPSSSFDCLIAADVLEHLRDPERVLRRLLPFLTEDACLIVSIPNVRHAGVLEQATRGYWTYHHEGILDRTHLRFFTWREIEQIFANLGFEVEERRSNDDDNGVREWERLGRPVSPCFGTLTLRGLDQEEVREFFVIQWLVRFRARRPSHASGLDREPIEVPSQDAPAGDARFPISVAEDPVKTELANERERSQSLQVDLDRRTRQLSALQDEFSELSSSYHELGSSYHELGLDHERVREELHNVHEQLALTTGSLSWRALGPLRRAARRYPLPVRIVRTLLHGRAGIRRARRRLTDVSRWAATPQMRTRLRPRQRARSLIGGLAGSRMPRGATRITPAITPRAIHSNLRPDPTSNGKRGRLVYLSHVLAYPPRAGAEYRINRMLAWLSSQGWDVLVIVYPSADDPVDADDAARAAAHYPNLLVCQPDRTLLYSLSDGVALLDGLRGRRPYDFLLEVVRHVQATFDPAVVVVTNTHLARSFSCLPVHVLKLVDTVGMTDEQPALPAQMTDRADAMIILPGTEPRLAGKHAIEVSVDFPLVRYAQPNPDSRMVLVVASAAQRNIKGLRDFLRYCWPLVLRETPNAELHVIGTVGACVDGGLPGVRIVGEVDELAAAYSSARVVINPAITGDGLQIKTLEALCHMRPIVLWPAGAQGIAPEMKDLCFAADNWYDFARQLLRLLNAPADSLAPEQWSRRVTQFNAERVYAPLGAVLDARTPTATSSASASLSTHPRRAS